MYDASAKEGKYGISLNACLRVGPPLAKYVETDPQIAARLAMNFHVDDPVCGAQDINGCRTPYSSDKEHMKKVGFKLRKRKPSDHTLAKELDNEENLSEGHSVSATEETYAK